MKKTMLLAVVMMLGLAAAAFAQPGATFIASTESVTTVVKSGHTELTGDIYLTVATPSPAPIQGTFTLQYSVPVTSVVPGGIDLSLSTLANVAVNADSSGPDGMIILNINAPAGGASGQYIRIHGVRVDAAASTTNTVSVSITSTGNAIQNGQFTANVINGMKSGLLADTDNTVAYEVNGLKPLNGVAELVLKEGFLNAFGKTEGVCLTCDPTQTTAQTIRIKLSAAPPAGATIFFPPTAVSNGSSAWAMVDAAGDPVPDGMEIDDTATGADLEVYYKLVSSNTPTLQESFELTGEGGIEVNVEDADLPIPASTITFQATLAPDKDAFTSKGTVAGLPIPRYAIDWLAAQDLVIFKGNTTALLVPLFMSKTVEVPQWGPGPAYYDTGLAIANTTLDPGKSKMGIDSAAIKQSGKINFYIFLQGETTPTIYTTGAASPGSGLDADGNLPSGSTYIVLASEILTAAGLDVTEDFQGYMIVVTNFTNAHGIEYVGDFIHVMQTSAMHVINPDRQVTPESLGQ